MRRRNACILGIGALLLPGLLGAGCTERKGGGGGGSEGEGEGSEGEGEGTEGEGEGSEGEGEGTEGEGEYGFTIRLPELRTIPCEFGRWEDEDELSQRDADWLCTFVHGSHDGFIYVQTHLTGCTEGLGPIPVFTADGGWISLGGRLTPLTQIYYDIGGGHTNDFLEFDFQGLRYKYYHSSFGYGWRACHTMDCLQVYEEGALLEDGCTSARTLPVVCVEIQADGTHAPLVDDMARCPGDEG